MNSFNEKEEDNELVEQPLDDLTITNTLSFENELNSSLIWASPTCRKQSDNLGYANQRSEQINRHIQQELKSKSQKRSLLKEIPVSIEPFNELGLLNLEVPTFFKFISVRSEVASNLPKERHLSDEVPQKRQESLTNLDMQIMRSLKNFEGSIDRPTSRFKFGKKEFQTEERKTKSLVYAFYTDTGEILKKSDMEEKKTRMGDFASQKFIFRQF